MLRSIATFSSVAGGIEARSCGSRATSRSTVSITLAPGWRITWTITAAWLFDRPRLRMSSTESRMVATSVRRTGAPLR